MPQLIVIALIGAGFYAAYRWMRQASDAITAELNRAEDEHRQRAGGGRVEKDLGRLEYDAGDGRLSAAKAKLNGLRMDRSGRAPHAPRLGREAFARQLLGWQHSARVSRSAPRDRAC